MFAVAGRVFALAAMFGWNSSRWRKHSQPRAATTFGDAPQSNNCVTFLRWRFGVRFGVIPRSFRCAATPHPDWIWQPTPTEEKQMWYSMFRRTHAGFAMVVSLGLLANV